MMISNVGSAGATGGMDLSRMSGLGFDPNKAMAPVAQALGMSIDELRAARRDGKTLDQLAAGKGVSHTDLVAAIKQGLKDAGGHGPGGVQAASSTSTIDPLDRIAEDIATGMGPGGPHGAHHRPPMGVNNPNTDILTNVSSLLKMSSDDLVAALTNGTSLADLAKQRGVGTDDLLKTVGTGMVLRTNA